MGILQFKIIHQLQDIFYHNIIVMFGALRRMAMVSEIYGEHL